MSLTATRSVFYVSDGTAATAQALGRGMLAQFDGELRQTRISGIDSFERLYAAIEQVRNAREQDGAPPLVFATLVNAEHLRALMALDCVCFDLFEPYIDRMSQALKAPPNRRVRPPQDGDPAGDSAQDRERARRIAAIDFALAHDDGASVARLTEADVVLVGVSRSGKTPTCLYLAMRHGIKAANCPLTPDDFRVGRLPAALASVSGKLVGLTVAPQRLADVRGRRLPGSQYASLAGCRDEVDAAARLMRAEGIPCLDATAPSVEELARSVLAARGLRV